MGSGVAAQVYISDIKQIATNVAVEQIAIYGQEEGWLL